MLPRQCRAKSKQSQRRCRRFAIPGRTVCHMHGGAAPQVKWAAQRRAAAFLDPTFKVLERSLARTGRQGAGMALKADLTVLDVAGLKPRP